MALTPEETFTLTDDDKATADALEALIDKALLGRRSREFKCSAGLYTADLVVRAELARRYRAARWHVYDVEDLDKPLRLVAA